MSDPLFWDTIFSMDITSAEVLSSIATIVYSPTKVDMARELQGEEAQSFVDLIDRVSDAGELPSVLRVLIMRHSFSLYPTSMGDCSDGARDCSTRSVKLAGYYPPHMSFNQSSPMLASLGGAGVLRT